MHLVSYGRAGQRAALTAAAGHCLPTGARAALPILLLAILLGLLPGTRAPATVRASYPFNMIFVDDSATGMNTGNSWEHAYTSLQPALNRAGSGEEIWVAAGVYTPTALTNLADPRSATFQLKNDVAIFGGFAGTEYSRTLRDWVVNPTILSGDIGASGVVDNSYHVVVGSGTDASAILDGVIITGGNANGLVAPDDRGAGMYNDSGNPTLANVTFGGNSATNAGGGIYNDASNPALVNVTFVGNAASFGGGVYNDESSPALVNVTFSGNSATVDGGALYNLTSSPVLVQTSLSGNTAAVPVSTGSMSNHQDSHVTVRNSILWGNSGGQIADDGTSSTTVDYSLVQGGYPGTGNIDAEPRFVDANGADNAAGTADDDLRLRANSPAVDAGKNGFVPADSADLDGDEDRTETLPHDQDGRLRFVDQPSAPDRGTGPGAIVDMGAYETSPIIFVDDSATGRDDGSTWENAYTDLHDALSHADHGNEIWAAAGTYKPTDGLARTLSFPLKRGVGIYGGFAGGEMTRAQRNWQTNETVLSGDLGESGFAGDNSYHVVIASGADASAILDGVTITGGNADGTYPDDRGGGIHNQGGSPTLANITVSGSYATMGGGMYNANGSPTLANATFRANNAVQSGGGIHNEAGSPRLSNAVFNRNSAAANGGGMYNDGSSPVLVNTTFIGNSAEVSGGGIYNAGSTTVVRNSILWGNRRGAIVNVGPSAIIEYSLVAGGYPGTGNLSAAPHFMDVDGTDDIQGTADDDLRPRGNSPAVDAGNNNFVPADRADLDGDGQRREKVPLDPNGIPRFMDRVAKADTGVGPIPIVDMGAYEARLIFVDDDGVDFGKGTSWETAVTDLQYALSLAKSGDEIWMAAGTYVPALLTSDSSRGISFEIKSGVAIFGGFAGGETHARQRDWTVNVTVLSGDLEGDDITDANGVVPHAGGIAGMNSFQVVDASGTDATTILDGVTITGGDAHGNDFWYGGGGMYSSEGSLTVANVTFRGNRAESTGGGLCILQGDPKLVNVTFIGNRGGGGGGMYDAASHLKLTDVTFIGNSAYSGGGMATISSNAVLTNITFIGNSANEGGGLVSAGGGGATLVNVSFKGNAGRIGGGMYNESANPSLANVIFSGNSARRGGALYNNEGRPTLSHVTFSKNAARRGGAIYNVFRSHPTVHNSILWDNGALAIFNDPDDPDPDNQSSATVGYSLIQGGYSGRGNVDADPHFLDADGADDKAGTADDDLRLHPSSPAVDAGNNGFVPADGFDLDGDGRRRERLPLDFDDAPRFVDIAAKADSGAGTPPIVDMGAFETQAGGHVATPTRAPTTTATVTGTPATTRTTTATQPATATRTPTTTATQPATATRTPTTTATRTTRATQTSTSTPRDTTTPTSTAPSTPRGTGTATATRMASATSAATTTATPIAEARLLFLPLIQRGP